MNTNAFEKELALIKDETIRNLTIMALDKVPEDFLHVPASSTGKYHPSYAQGDGGLLRHTQGVVYFINLLTGLKMYDISEETRDLLISAAILHDSCKGGSDWSNPYVFEHPLLVEALLDDKELTFVEARYWKKINSFIRTHMGQWTESKYSKTVLPEPETKEQMLLHLADYLASRKEIDLKIFDTSVEEVNAAVLQPATEPQKRFVASLIRQAREKEGPNEKYDCIEVENLRCMQASQLINELRQLVGC